MFRRGSKFYSKISSRGSIFFEKLVPRGTNFGGSSFAVTVPEIAEVTPIPKSSQTSDPKYQLSSSVLVVDFEQAS